MTEAIIPEDQRATGLLEAQARAAALFRAVEEAVIVAPGVRDSDATAAVVDLAASQFGVQRHWHKRIIRSGPNTLQPYQENPPDRTMTDDDIVYADFGPVFDDWEGDFGRTWVIGTDPHKLRLRDDLAIVFEAGKRFFAAHPDITAAELYAEVVRLSNERGWEYGNFHCGHLVGEFPHENFDGEKVESVITTANTKVMRRADPSGRIGHWILEVHLVDREREIGGFYEELLSL